MGNNPSRTSASGSAPQSPASTSHGTPTAGSMRRDVRRRESIQALSTTKATAAPPSANLESATGQPASQIRQLPSHSRSRSQTVASPQSKTQEQGSKGPSPTEIRPRAATPPLLIQRPSSPIAQPVDIPAGSDAPPRFDPSPIDPSAPSAEQHYLPPSQFNRPPRLPLPIEEEIQTPGSPIITPADLAIPAEDLAYNDLMPRRTSMLSTTTADDDEIGDELHTYALSGEVRPTVPTVIEWRGGGQKVYVTGTFAGWDRKFKLHLDGPVKDEGVFSAVIQLPAGTHHIKFIVDGDMRTSDEMPTAVDYTNILVNYVEVSPEGLPATDPVETPKAEPVIPPGLHPPQTLPPTPELEPVSAPRVPVPRPPKQTEIKDHPRRKYHNQIPQFLLDADTDEHSSTYRYASAALSTYPQPPSLPMFLSKSILNSATPMKDDASVLIMPNHTVLNHLATSSIRGKVLATNATTRYKNKFLTTIICKPSTEKDEDE